MVTIERICNPSIRAEYEETLPSQQQRRDTFTTMPSLCWGRCGNAMARAELKVCSKCKLARYCSKECQRIDWRTVHKFQCSSATNLHPNDLTLKLAERFIAIKHLLCLLTFHSILNLDLLNDRNNSNRFAVNVVCKTAPADIVAHLERSLSGEDVDPNEPVRLAISSIRRVPLEEAPLAAQKGAAESRAKGTRHPVTNALSPIITAYFTCAEGKGRHLDVVFGIFSVEEWHLEYMASKPKIAHKSSIFGESEVDLSTQSIQEVIDNYIERDKENKLRLRMYPNGSPVPPQM